MINIFVANIFRYIHLLLIFYVFTGFIITPIKYLKYYIFMLILIFLDWNDSDGQCILTGLEHRFRTGKCNKKSARYENAPEFFRPLINKLFNLNLSRDESDRLNNFIFMLCLLFAFIRYMKHSILISVH